MLNNRGYRHTFRICNTYCLFYGKIGYANATQCYVIRIWPVLLNLCTAWQWQVLTSAYPRTLQRNALSDIGEGDWGIRQKSPFLFTFRSFNSQSFQLGPQTAERNWYQRPWTVSCLAAWCRLTAGQLDAVTRMAQHCHHEGFKLHLISHVNVT